MELKKRNVAYLLLGASNHTNSIRQMQDYYATEPKAAELLLKVETFNNNIWECACGEGHLARVFEKYGYNVKASDLIDRGYGEVKDFLFFNDSKWDGDIITNPPYNKAEEFIRKAIEIIPIGNKVAMFLRLQFLESKRRKQLFKEYPPKVIYISSSRIMTAKNGEFKKYRNSVGSAIAFAWYIWQKGYKKDTILKWIN
jgi:hypothetical protein